MKISVAQIRLIKGNIIQNIENHIKLIALAISYQTDAIFFPELSVTGYEPELAKGLATNQDDHAFDEIQKLSDGHKLTIGLGMPTRTESGIQISMIIFQSGLPKKTYSKQQLHADETPYFVSGQEQIVLLCNNKKIVPAICYESLQVDHSYNVNKLGAEIYIASVAKSKNNLDKAILHYSLIAKKYSMPVLMSNCVGSCDNFESIGKSAVWTKQGNLIGQLDETQEGILVFDTETEEIFEVTI